MILIESYKDKRRALEILNDAFLDTPGIMWVLKRRSKVSKKMTIRVLFYEGIAKKGAYMTSNKSGVLLFFAADNRGFNIFNGFRKVFLVLFFAGIKNGMRLIKYRKIISEIRPKNALVGFLVATDRKVIGSRAAYEINREMTKMGELEKRPICLETSIPRAKKLYVLAGYKVYHTIKHPYEESTIWFLKKEFKNGKEKDIFSEREG